jgi:hypothetical protein
MPASGQKIATQYTPYLKCVGFAVAGASLGAVVGLALRSSVEELAGYMLTMVLVSAGTVAGLFLAEPRRWRQTGGPWELVTIGAMTVVCVALLTASLQWEVRLGGVGLTFCLVAWLAAGGCGTAAMALTETDRFVDRFIPWSLQPPRAAGPFPTERVSLGALAGSSCGWLLTFLPRILMPGARSGLVTNLTAAGMVLWTVAGAVAGAFAIRKVALEQDSTIYRLLATLAVTGMGTLAVVALVALVSAISVGAGGAVLGVLGAVSGVCLGLFVTSIDRLRRFLASLT